MRRGLGAPGLKVGILGGSFNPAHDGHRHISLLALKLLHLDEVWWLVSPQNPLKPVEGMAPFEERLEGARELARHPNIIVTDLEQRLGTRYTAETLPLLRQCFPRTQFVWIMGADNLVQISHWHRWTKIFNTMPIAVFDRAPFGFDALAGQAAHAFARFKLKRRDACRLVEKKPPAWTFFHTQLHPGSATQIRARRALSGDRRAAAAIAGNGREKGKAKVKPEPMAPEALLAFLRNILEDYKAEDIVAIPLRGKSSIADFMLIATGRSSRQVAAMAERIADEVKKLGKAGVRPEGLPQADWVLIDAGDVVVHLFRPEVRAFYNLEKMWQARHPEDDRSSASG
ncbi:MAG: nicotinate-nucleotide adenylyltransferase [Rhodospirillales bacterium]